MLISGFPGGSAGKESTCNVGDLGSIPGVGKIPWRRERLPTPVFWLGEFHGQYTPWGRKERDTPEQLSLSLCLSLLLLLSYTFLEKKLTTYWKVGKEHFLIFLNNFNMSLGHWEHSPPLRTHFFSHGMDGFLCQLGEATVPWFIQSNAKQGVAVKAFYWCSKGEYPQ